MSALGHVRDEILYAKIRKFVQQSGYLEATDALIDRNYSVISAAMEAQEGCSSCSSLEACPNKSNGYAMGMKLDKSGWIRMVMHPCQFRFTPAEIAFGQARPNKPRRAYMD